MALRGKGDNARPRPANGHGRSPRLASGRERLGHARHEWDAVRLVDFVLHGHPKLGIIPQFEGANNQGGAR